MQFHASTKYKYYSQDMSIEHLYLVSLFCLSRGILNTEYLVTRIWNVMDSCH